MATHATHDHRRIQTSVLAPVERWVLKSFARMMPPWVNSDHLTLLGALGMVSAASFYALGSRNPLFVHLASLAIILNWFGDSMDGTLARHRNRLRPRYGYYVDHILDSFGAVLVVTGLALGGFMSLRVAAVFLAVYFLLNIHIYLTTTVTGEFKISFGWLGPTELRMGLIVGNWFLIRHPVVHLAGQSFLLFDIGASIGAGLLLLILIVASTRVARRLYHLES
jgi:archaetidylinositol phosphate synthase